MKLFNISLLLILALLFSGGCILHKGNALNCEQEDKETCENMELLVSTKLLEHGFNFSSPPPAYNPAGMGELLLDNIILNGGVLQPHFDTYRFFYVAEYPKDTPYIQLTVIPTNNDVKLSINNTSIFAGETYTVPLLSDEEFIEVNVSETNDNNTQSYLLIIRRVNAI